MQGRSSLVAPDGVPWPRRRSCGDGAATAEAALAARLEHVLGWTDTDLLEQHLAAFLALHDIGKMTPVFQAKVPELWPADVLGVLRADLPRDPGHGASGLTLLALLEQQGDLPFFMGWLPSEIQLLLGAFTGHHGRPVGPVESLPERELLGPNKLILTAAAGFVLGVHELLNLSRSLPVPAELERATWPLAGLATLADWIGSQQAWFPYAAPPQDLSVYWRERAMPQAEVAASEAGNEPAAVRCFGGFRALAGSERVPSPLQAWAEQVAFPDGPVLVVIEDVTGAGKTEAAVLLAHRMMAAGRASGLVMALPTMATANAMFARLGAVYRRLFVGARAPSLALAHSGAGLHKGFAAAARVTTEARV